MGVFKFMRKCLIRFPFFRSHLFLIVITGFFQDMLDFRNRDNREEFREQEITGEKQSERPEIKSNLPDGRRIIGCSIRWVRIPGKWTGR